MSSSASKSVYAIDFVGRSRPNETGAGGNVVLTTQEHALDGPEHTGQLPADRVSYDPSTSGLGVTDAQAAIDALASSVSGASMVPTSIGSGETFLVPVDRQALFAMTIDVVGTLDVRGYLVEVD